MLMSASEAIQYPNYQGVQLLVQRTITPSPQQLILSTIGKHASL